MSPAALYRPSYGCTEHLGADAGLAGAGQDAGGPEPRPSSPLSVIQQVCVCTDGFTTRCRLQEGQPQKSFQPRQAFRDERPREKTHGRKSLLGAGAAPRARSAGPVWEGRQEGVVQTVRAGLGLCGERGGPRLSEGL